jgi:hypothetical protein
MFMLTPNISMEISLIESPAPAANTEPEQALHQPTPEEDEDTGAYPTKISSQTEILPKCLHPRFLSGHLLLNQSRRLHHNLNQRSPKQYFNAGKSKETADLLLEGCDRDRWHVNITKAGGD